VPPPELLRQYEGNDLQYLLLIYQAEAEAKARGEAAQAELFAAYGAFTRSIKESGNHRGGEALQPVANATAVRVRDGKTLVTDGPFAETREQLVGYYLIEAEHLDEAIAIAARIPSAGFGTIEVRPIWVFPASA
jgi:hypothetical protein